MVIEVTGNPLEPIVRKKPRVEPPAKWPKPQSSSPRKPMSGRARSSRRITRYVGNAIGAAQTVGRGEYANGNLANRQRPVRFCQRSAGGSRPAVLSMLILCGKQSLSASCWVCPSLRLRRRRHRRCIRPYCALDSREVCPVICRKGRFRQGHATGWRGWRCWWFSLLLPAIMPCVPQNSTSGNDSRVI